jgi:hypothetical protein
MLSPDEIIEIGFANLRQEVSKQSPEEFLAQARRQDRAARIKTVVFAGAGCLAIAATLAIAFKPMSAYAALRESARLSSSQSIVHLRVVNHDTYEHPSIPPTPDDLPIDIWRFPDHYIRKQGHVVKKLFKDGRYLAYDDRFTSGFSWKYDANNDPIWTADGSIGPEIAKRRPIPVQAHTVHTDRGEETVYEWTNRDAHRNGIDEHIYVNKRTNLIDFAEGDLKEPDGRRNHGTNVIDYPDERRAERDAGGFPSSLRFRTKRELLDDLNQRIVVPEQSKTLSGVRVTLYGVIVFPNLPDGIGVRAIVRGNAGRNGGAGHPVKILGTPLFKSKRSDLSPEYHDLVRAKYTAVTGLAHQLFISAESDDLLANAPSQVTLRVPVWRNTASAESAFGIADKSDEFIGYVTFTTSKLFYNIGNGYLPSYGDPRPAN